jgi:paraquat-inducible protein A
MAIDKPLSPPDLAQLIACHECDLLQRRRPLQNGQRACCLRCGAVLYRQKRRSLERSLALTITSLILYGLAIGFPFMTLEIQGRAQSITLPSGIWQLYEEGLWLLALIVAVMILLAPLCKILGLLYVLLPLMRKRVPPRSALTYRIVEFLHPWSMMEIYLIGTLVALVKMGELASIILGVAFWSFIALIITETAAGVALDPHTLWEHIED